MVGGGLGGLQLPPATTSSSNGTPRTLIMPFWISRSAGPPQAGAPRSCSILSRILCAAMCTPAPSTETLRLANVPVPVWIIAVSPS